MAGTITQGMADITLTSADFLKPYDITENLAFIPPKPLDKLPDQFEDWNRIAHSLHTLLREKTLRDEVRSIPDLDPSALSSVEELRCAYMFLTFISNGYVWQDGDAGVPQVLPRKLAVPLDGVIKRLGGLQPVLGYATTVLYNWRLKNERSSFDNLDIDDIETIINVEDSGGSDWFFRVSWFVDYKFAPALQWILAGIDAAKAEDASKLQECLENVTEVVQQMQKAMNKMHEKLTADTFYNKVRPYFAGWGGEGSALPNGLVYEGVSENPVQMTGGSAAQSSTIQALDAFLGIVHKKENQEFLDKMVTYMPAAHGRFINYLKEHSEVADFVKSHVGDGNLKDTYNSAIGEIVKFRSSHINIVTKYVVSAAARQQQEDQDNEYGALATRGTGGSVLIPFLKSIRESATHSKIDSEESESNPDE